MMMQMRMKMVMTIRKVFFLYKCYTRKSTNGKLYSLNNNNTNIFSNSETNPQKKNLKAKEGKNIIHTLLTKGNRRVRMH